MRRVGSLRAAGLAAVVFLGGCDSGPEGPGTMEATATGEALGAVVLEVEGAGIRGFEARGETRVYSARVVGRDGVHRVVLVDPVGGALRFGIDVDDLGMDGPFVRVVTAASTSNSLLLVPNVDVAIER